MADLPETPEAYRRRTLAALGPPHRLGECPWSELVDFPIFPGTTLGSTPIVVPGAWMPSQTARGTGHTRIDPTLRGRLKPDATGGDAKRVEAIRRCLLALWMTRRTKNGSSNYKPSSWSQTAQLFLRLATRAVDLRPGGDDLFTGMTADEVRAVVSDVFAGSEILRIRAHYVLRYLADAGERGVLTDYPIRLSRERTLADAGRREGGTAPEEATLEDDLSGVYVPWRTPTDEDRAGRPFRDEFVTALIGGAMWVQRNLADTILTHRERLDDLKAEIRAKNKEASDQAIYERQLRALRGFEWRYADGRQIERGHIEAAFGSTLAVEWPPTKLRTLSCWITILQGLNLQLLAFCTGARKSEVGSADDDAVVGEGDNARFAARTYKTVTEIGGRPRDWPLHPAGAEAVRIQTRLAAIFRSEEADHLWVVVRNSMAPLGAPLGGLTGQAQTVSRYLGIEDLAGPDSVDDVDGGGSEPGRSRNRANLHRWRHTVARLVALSIVEAPQVLYRLFGHNSLEMTLHYMLSREGIAEEAKRIAEEMALVMVERALEDSLNGDTSGAVSERVAAALKDYGQGGDPYSSEADDDDDDHGEPAEQTEAGDGHSAIGRKAEIKEVARAVTENRRPWSVVRPGVFCTKTWNEFGPCTQGWRAPDVGACRTGCTHRLETSVARDHCRRQLHALLAELSSALADGATMRAANLKGQIRANLVRWRDVREEVLARSELARGIWGAAA